METWQRQLSGSITKVDQLPFIPEDPDYRRKLNKVAEVFPIRINAYFADQIKSANDPLWKQVVPRSLTKHTSGAYPSMNPGISPLSQAVSWSAITWRISSSSPGPNT